MVKVKHVMSGAFAVLPRDATVREAAVRYREGELRRIVVVDGRGTGAVVGTLSAECFLRAITEELDVCAPVEQIMNREFCTVDEETLVEDLPRETVPTVVAVNAAGRVVGILTRSDLMAIHGGNCWLRNEQVKAIFDALPNGVVFTDNEGAILLVNRAAEKMLGEEAARLEGALFGEVFRDEHLPRVVATGVADRNRRRVINGVVVLRNILPSLKGGKTHGVLVTFQDVSELETMADELNRVKELNRDLEGIIESSFDGIVVADGSGRVLRCNRSFVNLARCLPGNQFSETVVEPVIARALKKGRTVTIKKTVAGNRELLLTANPIFGEGQAVERVVCNIRDMTELESLRREMEQSKDLSIRYCEELATLRSLQLELANLVVSSPVMQRVVEQAIRVASVDSTVLITGETGVGKEVIAKLIHQHSPRKDRPFIQINCGAIPEALIESELFGYEKGAFTGASRTGKVGLLEAANHGTLLLDEIGELPLSLQVKLLRVLQEQQIIRVGSVRPTRVDVRIIAVTNRNLEKMVGEGRFRADLFYRLNVVPIYVPPLRERREDIVSLARYFVERYNRKYGLNKRLAPATLTVLERYAWPGNVRELENVIERMVIMSGGQTIEPQEVLGYLQEKANPVIGVDDIIPLREASEMVERQLILKALARFKSTRKAARVLGVDHSTIVRKLGKYQLQSG